MDALDPSEGMLAVADQKNIYGQMFQDLINDKQLPIAESELLISDIYQSVYLFIYLSVRLFVCVVV